MRLNATGSQFFAAGATLLASLVLLTGCKSKPSVSEESKQPAPANTVAADHFDGGTYCVQKFLEGPPLAQPLHFSNQVIESDPAMKTKDFQADLSGDNVDLVHRDKWLATDADRALFEDTKRFDDPKVIVRNITNGIEEETVTNHATRSDGVSWRGVIVSVAHGGTPWNLFVSKPTVNRVGPETVNGYDTIKYTVDTTHDSQTDKAALMMLGHLQDYNITGTAWVLKDANCVLQYSIDYQETGKDGKVSKTHYEGTITKK
jgi:hypothetical protein